MSVFLDVVSNYGAAIAIAAAFVLAIVLFFLSRKIKKHRIVFFSALRPWAATFAGVGLAIAMISAALDRRTFLSSLTAPDTGLGYAAVVLELLAGLALFLGLFARAGAIIAILLAILGIFFDWPRTPFLLPFLGAAFFVLVWGRGRLSLGSVWGRIFFAMDSEHARPIATAVMRILIAIFVLYLTLANVFPWIKDYPPAPDLWPGFLAAIPSNIKFPALLFLEALLGFLLFFGVFLRPIAILLGFVFCVLAFTAGGFSGLAYGLTVPGALIALFIVGRDD